MYAIRFAGALALVLLTGVLTGCSPGLDEEVDAVVTDFYEAVGNGDGAAAGDLLAPETRSELEQSSGKPCDQAVTEEVEGQQADSVTVRRFGDGAQARVGGDVAFLGRFDAGWLVTAAGCTPRPDKPYQCSVKGA